MAHSPHVTLLLRYLRSSLRCPDLSFLCTAPASLPILLRSRVCSCFWCVSMASSLLPLPPHFLSNPYSSLQARKLVAERSGRASPIVNLLSGIGIEGPTSFDRLGAAGKGPTGGAAMRVPQVIRRGQLLQSQGHGGTEEAQSYHGSPIQRKITQLLDKSALKLAHLQCEELSVGGGSQSGRCSPMVTHLSHLHPSTTAHAISKKASSAFVTLLAVDANKPIQVLALSQPQSSSSSSSSMILQAATQAREERASPVSFYRKYVEAEGSGCHTPTASYPGLDHGTLEVVRRRQEDLRRKFRTAAPRMISV